MRYTINKTNYHDFYTVEINKLPARAYFIPYKAKDDVINIPIEKERFSSGIVDVISGKWDFKYYDKVSIMPDEIDTDNVDFDEIIVPSTWQRIGYEPPVYLNWRYPFRNMSNECYPSIPKDVSCGVYRKKFNIKDKDKNHIITFLGVISSLDLYVNGEFVGYSEGAHNSAEFDISKYIDNGENELVAVVYKWSNATYLECQDMFRENGIFRDVYITENESTYIYDFFNRYHKKDDGTYEMLSEVKVCGDTEDYSVLVEIEKDGKLLYSNECANEFPYTCDDSITLFFDSLDVIEWNAEKPELYNIYITLKKNNETLQVIRSITGFKDIKINGSVYKFNGQPIKLKGVNHHDSHPVKGYALSHDDIIKDITLMKELNVNAVRTSHYPPDPFFLSMCDKYGIYVIDEADNESHGCWDFLGKVNTISNDLMWAHRFCDRVERMYYRDRNHPSIAMWSMGNECFGHRCFDAAYGMIKADSEIPIFYEGVSDSIRSSYDVFSNMYPKIKVLHDKAKVADGEKAKINEKIKDRDRGIRSIKENFANKPYFMCEYSHAMGIGPGELEEYWQEIYSHESLMGGCIWEWVDHVATNFNKDLKYTYGGDHGEELHDGNFCVDALIYPDRVPHTGGYEMKAVYRPLRIKHNGGKEFKITNTNYFKSSSDYKIKWSILKDGVECENGELTTDVKPYSTEEYVVDFNTFIDKQHEYHITFTYFDENGFEVAKEQCALSEFYNKICTCTENSVVIDDKKISFDNGYVLFNDKGEIESYNVNGVEFMSDSPASGNKGFIPNLNRAYHDNDVWFRNEQYAEKTKITFNSISVDSSNRNAVVKVTYDVTFDNEKAFESLVEYTVKANGVISVNAKLIKVSDNAPESILRFGLNFEMPESFENIEYFGLGEKENLIDFNAHTVLGIYKSKVVDMHEPYVFPQENGYHTKVRWLNITDNNGKGIKICNGNNDLNFNAHDYTVDAILQAKHQEEIIRSNTTVINVDGYLMGSGSNSCGPFMLDKHRVYTNGGKLEYSFDIIPIV